MKKLLLGLGSITAVVAPVAAVISCGVEVSISEIHGENGTDVQTTTTQVDAAVATTVNESVASFHGNLVASDITKTEKVTNFVFGSMHPVTYDYAVSYTLAAKDEGLKLTFGSQNINMGHVNVKDGDKLVIAVKMPSTTRRAEAKPDIYVFVVPADGVGPADLHITDQDTIEKLANEILLPLFPEINEKLGGPLEVNLGAVGANPITWTDLLAKIKAVIKPTTDGVVLKLGSSNLRVHFAAGANDDAIKTAITNAVTHESSFSGCFDMSK